MQIQRRQSARPAAGSAPERLAALVASGASPSRTASVASAFVAELRARNEDWKERLDDMQSEIEEGITAAEAYAADVEDGDVAIVQAQLGALRAARQVLDTETRRCAQEERPTAATARDPGRWTATLRRYG
jgi:hypothetical protein